MELGEAVDRISWGEWNWKVILVGTRPLEICSSLKLYTDLLTVIKVWSGTSWGFELHVRESLLEQESKNHVTVQPMNPRHGHRTHEKWIQQDALHCRKISTFTLSERAKTSPNVPPSPKIFLQSWDSTSCWPGHRGNYKPLAKLFPSLCTGPCWAGIKERGSPAQPRVLPLGWGKTKQIYQGTSWFWMQGLFWSFLSDFALLKHEASSWPGVWRQVFPSVPGKEAGSFIGSRHSFHSCLCQLWIRLFFWRTSLINWKLVNPLHGSGFSLEQCSNTRAVLHLELWHFSRWLQPCT